MERTTEIKLAKKIMRKNFFGLPELTSIQEEMGISIPDGFERLLPMINFDEKLLSKSKNDYLLILGIPFCKDEKYLSLKSMREHFGYNSEMSEPCFYNQDWYLNEDFYLNRLELKWYLVRKSVINETRSQSPEEVNSNIYFPSAVLCAYVFFAFWFRFKKALWNTDYIWCSDYDHNGDRIYVGRYMDPQGINKNGFSIHRHLRINNNYGCINAL